MLDAQRRVEADRFAPTAAETVPDRRLPLPTAGDLIPEVSILRYKTDLLQTDASKLKTDVTGIGQEVLVRSLAERTAIRERQGVQPLLEVITGAGLSWTLLSRLVGVSVPAIRKWRLGDGASPDNRHAVAEVAALLEMLEEQFMIEDPAAWLEIPLADTSRTVADILAAGRRDLVLAYAHGWQSPYEVLDRFDPGWREAERAREFETFVAEDGELAIRRRSGR